MSSAHQIKPFSQQDHSRMGGSIPVGIPNLSRLADRYWPEIPDNDLNLMQA
jgi:hypothetical protein